MITHKYNKRFQGLRGYAILLIFLSHNNLGWNKYGIYYTTWLGSFGVSLFIFLSGYLLLESNNARVINTYEYIKSRVIKYYPSHILMLVLSIPLSLSLLCSFDKKTWFSLGLNAVLLQSWFPDASIYYSFNSVSWYLSLTVFLVVIGPLVIRFWKSVKSEHAILIVLLIFAVEFLWSYVWSDGSWDGNKTTEWLVYIFPIARSLDFIGGAGIWKVYHSHTFSRTVNEILVLFGIIGCLLLLWCSLNQSALLWFASVWTIPCSVLIGSLSTDSRIGNMVFSNQPTVMLGNISFELFLSHLLCIKYLTIVLNKIGIPDKGILRMFIYLIISLLVAHSWHCLKRYGLKAKNRHEETKTIH